MNYQQFYIDGEWVSSSGTETIDVLNPATDEVIDKVSAATTEDVDRAVKAAKKAFPSWSALTVAERASYFKKLKQALKDNLGTLADLMTAELGATTRFSHDVQVTMSINEMEATIRAAETYQFDHYIRDALVTAEPIGVVACISPWNYPLNQIQRKISPALLAGNTVVVKPATETPLTALYFAKLIDEVGFPAGVFNILTGSGSKVGTGVASHPDVDVISFTGSTEVGEKLYAAGSKGIKKIILELGGKSPMLLLPGGSIKTAVKKTLGTIINNQGQSCSALTRLIVPKDDLKAVQEELLAQLKDVKIGDPTLEDTDLGPVVSAKQEETVLGYIAKGKEEGATILTGGNKVDCPGHYIEPTVFVDVKNDMTIAQEEIFGPVLTVIPYESVEEGITISNDTTYGLSGAVVGPDEDEAVAIARKIRTGNVMVNEGAVTADSPFGGYKESGIGHEKGVYGFEDYLNIKAILR